MSSYAVRPVGVTVILALVGGMVSCGADDASPPRPLAMDPALGPEGAQVPVEITGEQFGVRLFVSYFEDDRSTVDSEFEARLGETDLLTVRFIDDHTLSAVVPDTLEPGSYTLTVIDPRGGTGELPAAFVVAAPADADSDGDGVPDAIDQCPGWDDALDADGDGVPDGCDICATGDDALDADGDGVPDGCDICATGDDALDDDGDGVPDGCDICATGDDALDDDGDGVPDGCDLCPGFDDAIDNDGNGVPDGCDSCTDDDADGVCSAVDCDDGDPYCTTDCEQCVCPVVSAIDTGAGTLRACLTYANGRPGTAIHFDLPDPPDQSAGADAWWQIAPLSALPAITAAGTSIDGTTQAVGHGETNSLGPEVELTGGGAGSTSGLVVDGVAGVVVRGIAVNGFAQHGLRVAPGSQGFALYGSVVGATPVGTSGPRTDQSGVTVETADARIGGPDPGDGNLIAYNWERGVQVIAGAVDCVIEGNLIRDQGYAGILGSADGLLVIGNLIRNNSTRNPWDELVLNSGSGGAVYHNTIHGSPGDGIHLAADGVEIFNNIITGCAEYGIRVAGGSMIESNNLITDASTAPANASGQLSAGALDPSDLNADPDYADAASGDFSLGDCSSPAVNAGLDLGGNQPDLNGPAAGAFDGALPDIGAFESTCP